MHVNAGVCGDQKTVLDYLGSQEAVSYLVWVLFLMQQTINLFTL